MINFLIFTTDSGFLFRSHYSRLIFSDFARLILDFYSDLLIHIVRIIYIVSSYLYCEDHLLFIDKVLFNCSLLVVSHTKRPQRQREKPICPKTRISQMDNLFSLPPACITKFDPRFLYGSLLTFFLRRCAIVREVNHGYDFPSFFSCIDLFFFACEVSYSEQN